MKNPIRPLLSALTLAALLALGAANAPAAILVLIPGIEGEATRPGYEGWIDVHSIDYQIERDAGTAGGAVKFGDFRIVKELDKSSPKLSEALLTNGLIQSLEIEQTATYGGIELSQFTILLENVYVTRHRIQSESTADGLRREEVSFTYRRITWTYKHRGSDGSLIEEVVFEWDRPAGN